MMKKAWIIIGIIAMTLIVIYHKDKPQLPDDINKRVYYCDLSYDDNFGRIKYKWKVKDIELKQKGDK
jgi:hypothetical protein